MKFRNMLVHKTPLILAIEKENIEILKLLIANKNVDVNIKCIFNRGETAEF